MGLSFPFIAQPFRPIRRSSERRSSSAAIMRLKSGNWQGGLPMLSSQSQGQSDHGDEVFLAFKEWLKIQEARHGSVADHPYGNGSSDSHRNEFHVSPGIAPIEPSIGVNPSQASFQSPGISRGRLSVGRRVFRTFAYGFIIIVTVGAALAWESSDDKTKDMVRSWGSSLSQLSPVLGTGSPAASAAAQPGSKTPEQASFAAGSFPQAQQQLETMVSDIADVRSILEQHAAKHEQIAKDVAALQGPSRSAKRNRRRLSHHPPVRRPKISTQKRRCSHPRCLPRSLALKYRRIELTILANE
jgi:hypothetical protein